MKVAIMEVAAVNLHCPTCDSRVPHHGRRALDSPLTWTRDDFTGGDVNGHRDQMTCPDCGDKFEIPKYAEVFRL